MSLGVAVLIAVLVVIALAAALVALGGRRIN
jgi:hypothetical protein